MTRTTPPTHKLILKTCIWTQTEDGDYDTDCGHKFVLVEGSPHENDMRFCCYCGARLNEALHEEEDDNA